MTPNRWAAVPAVRSSKNQLKVKLWLVLGGLLLAAALGPLAMFVSLSASRSEPPAPAPSSYSAAVAEAIATDFLAGKPTTSPVAKDVDPAFGRGPEPSEGLTVTSLTYASSTTLDALGRQVSVHTFIAVMGDRRFTVKVPMVDSPQGPVLAGLPSLAALDPAPADVPPIIYEEPTGATGAPALTETLRTKVEEWARAYAADDRAALQALSGDDTAGARYVGLGGFTVDRTVTLGNPISRASEEQDALAVPVTLVMSLPGDKKYQTAVQFDLLVLDPQSGLPKIAAWGPVGSGPTLRPYDNNTIR